MTDATPNAYSAAPGASHAPLNDVDLATYSALTTDAARFAWPNRWISFRGDNAREALNGLVTNEVSTINPGDVQYAAALTPKGKIIADLHIVALDATTFLTSVSLAAADAWLALARKYVNPRLAKVTEDTDREAWLLVGARAENISHTLSDAATVVRMPHHAHGFLLYVDTGDAPRLLQRLDALHVHHGSHAVLQLLRVEAGLPQWGIDMDDQTIPQEANLEQLHAISFDKGCYTGQETVARLHFRGHVNRRLRGLRAAHAMRRGATITDTDGKVVGDVRSSVMSPRYGAIAIAMLRREINAGDTVRVADDGVPIEGQVVELPFA